MQCRTCLQTQNDLLTSIFDTKADEMLVELDFCTVLEIDQLPKAICFECLQKLEECYKFRQLCRNSQLRLNEGLGATTPIHIIFTEFLEDSSGDFLDHEKHEIPEEEITESPIKEDLISFLEKPLPPPLPHQCEHCDQSFSEEHDLNIHQSIHSTSLTCMKCFKQFTGRQALKRHLKIHFIKKPHKCHICEKSFSESYTLVKHLRHHSGIPREKRHFCQYCSQGFSEPYYLKVHLRKHTGERPLDCPHCSKSFADPRSHKKHLLTHTEDKPFKCEICMKSFKKLQILEGHLKAHAVKPYICGHCHKQFQQLVKLKIHFKRCPSIQ